MYKLISAILALNVLSACGTSANFTRGLEEPVVVLKKASAISEDAETHVQESYAIGVLEDKFLPDLGKQPGDLNASVICRTWSGPSATKNSLAVFTDSTDTVKKVGEAPIDTSYSGYIRKFRENAAVDAPKDFEKEQAEADRKAEVASTTCESLFAIDSAIGSTLKSLSAPTAAASPALISRILGLDSLIKTGLRQAEAAQREAAVRITVKYLIPQLRKAKEELAKPADSAFGPLVVYPYGASNEAIEMNKTVLGATVTIRRWHVAKQIQEQWTYLEPCRARKGAGCLADPLSQHVANSFATNTRIYRNLSAVDPRKVEKSLQASIESAETSLRVGGIVEVIDALIGFSDSVKGLSDAYDVYDKSKD